MERCILLVIFLSAVCLAVKPPDWEPRHIIYGDCYDIKSPPNFNLTAFTDGLWYETERYSNFFESNAKCVNQSFVFNAGINTMIIDFEFVYSNYSLGGAFGVVNVTKEPDGNLTMSASFTNDSFTSSFSILATDYVNYAITYSCYQIPDTGILSEKQERLWVLSRTPAMSKDIIDIVEDALIYEGDGLGAYLYPTAQTNCTMPSYC